MPSNVHGSGPFSQEPGSISTSLLVRLKARQAEAWERLAELFGPVVFHWCLGANLQRADADDIVQEVFQTVATKIESFRRDRETDTFRGWLWTITRHKIGDFLRRRSRQPPAAGGSGATARLDALPADMDSSSDSECFDAGGLYPHVLNSLEREFRESTWQTFRQVVLEGLAPAVVAERLGITPNAVYLAKSRVLRRIREELGDVQNEP